MFDLSKINPLIKPSIELYSTHYKIPSRFLYALVMTESNFNPHAIRYEPNYKWLYKIDEVSKELNVSKEDAEKIQKTSYGLTQLMGAVFHQYYRFASPTYMSTIPNSLIACCIYLNTICKNRRVDIGKNPADVYDLYNSGVVNHLDGNEVNIERFKRNYLLF